MLKMKRKQSSTWNNNKRSRVDMEISSDSDAESDAEKDESEDETESEDDTELQKAKRSIEKLKAKIAIDHSDEDDMEDMLSSELRNEALKRRGKLQRSVAAKYQPPTSTQTIKGHNGPITCIACASDRIAFSSGKDSAVIKYDLVEGKRIKTIKGGKKNSENPNHSAHVLSIAVTSDGKYLATGDASNQIFVWDANTMEKKKVFKGHRGPVSALAFRIDTHQLFSGSHDRSIRHWNLDNMAFVESLFGHEHIITGIDSGYRERCVSSGGHDGSVRLWKIVEESQLVYSVNSKKKNIKRGSVECIALINDEHFITGTDDCSIQLWNVNKSSPVATASCAAPGEENVTDMWISSITARYNTDVLASGSRNGRIVLWCCSGNFTSLKQLFVLNTVGVVNDLTFNDDGSRLLAAVAREHKWGRWWTVKEAKDAFVVFNFDFDST